jgi:hypothetical protein
MRHTANLVFSAVPDFDGNQRHGIDVVSLLDIRSGFGARKFADKIG